MRERRPWIPQRNDQELKVEIVTLLLSLLFLMLLIFTSYFALSRGVRAYRATAEFFDRKLAASGERH